MLNANIFYQIIYTFEYLQILSLRHRLAYTYYIIIYVFLANLRCTPSAFEDFSRLLTKNYNINDYHYYYTMNLCNDNNQLPIADAANLCLPFTENVERALTLLSQQRTSCLFLSLSYAASEKAVAVPAIGLFQPHHSADRMLNKHSAHSRSARTHTDDRRTHIAHIYMY